MQIRKLKGGLIMSNTSKTKAPSVFSPLNGKAVPLASVPNPVFSDKVFGYGCAVIPDDGKLWKLLNCLSLFMRGNFTGSFFVFMTKLKISFCKIKYKFVGIYDKMINAQI